MSTKRWIFDKDPAFPENFEPHKISKCALELIDVGPVDELFDDDPDRLVHCILRVMLDPALTTESTYAPTNTYSLVLDVTKENSDPPAENARSLPVEMVIKACTYMGQHRHAMRVIDLPVNGNKTVGYFLHTLKTPGLNTCEFIRENGLQIGCRDFMSQVIRLLIDASFLAIPEGSQSALFKSFNSIPTDTMVDKQSPVTQAVFATSFNTLLPLRNSSYSVDFEPAVSYPD
ncbi:uncharacterized protein N7506_010303 [Penicillium brevicompactum]|uniref:uncharacterized protein n=1 Tax=Penicillium brevicompactum TaxID=5074 RepID=UPI0025419BF8|nr:uncharacterized protein N7506_010303 [Penicillium brevicompactum]KAJ5327201.1 hypothetical protein N7506_010303 [Penicillium brevicompactum]